MVEWPCCYDPLRLSLGSYDLFFTNFEHFSSSLSCPRDLWVTEVEEPQNRPRVYWGTEVSCAKYPGERKCTARKLSWGTEVHCANSSWGAEVQYRNYPGERKTTATEVSWGTEDDRDSPPPLLSRQVPPADGVLRSSAPQSDFHSHHP